MGACFFLLLFLSFSKRQGARDDDLCLREQGEHTTSACSRRCNARLAPRSPRQPEATYYIAQPHGRDGRFGIRRRLLWYQRSLWYHRQQPRVSELVCPTCKPQRVGLPLPTTPAGACVGPDGAA